MTTSLLQGPPQLTRAPTKEELADYDREGAARLTDIIDPSWIDFMREAVDRVLETESPMSREYGADGDAGRFYGDFFLWRREPEFRAFMADSPLPELAAHILKSEHVYFFYDQLLVKEPGSIAETPWHHDLSYWPIRGKQIVSIWIPFDHTTPETGAVTYARGSHRRGKLYSPAVFGEGAGFTETFAKSNLEPLPDLNSELGPEDLLTFSLKPGDVQIHHPLTLHYAPGNSSKSTRRRGLAMRYIGDDVVFDERPGTFLENPKMMALLPAVDLRDGDPVRGELFPEVWPRIATSSEQGGHG